MMRCDDAARVGVGLCGIGKAAASMIVSPTLVANLPAIDVLGAKLWHLPLWNVFNAMFTTQL